MELLGPQHTGEETQNSFIERMKTGEEDILHFPDSQGIDGNTCKPEGAAKGH